MDYKRFSDKAEVEEMLQRAKDGEYSSKAGMYNILVQIKSEWRGTRYAEMAQYLINIEFSEFAVFNED